MADEHLEDVELDDNEPDLTDFEEKWGPEAAAAMRGSRPSKIPAAETDEEGVEPEEKAKTPKPAKAEGEGVEASAGPKPVREQPEGLKEHQALKARAKSLGVPTSGTRDELRAAVDAAESEVNGLRESLKQRGVPDDDLSDATPKELQRMLRASDRLWMQQQEGQRRAMAARDQQWQRHLASLQQQQPPPPQAQPPANVQRLDLNAIREDYGEESPVYQQAVALQRERDQYEQWLHGWQAWANQNQQQTAQQQRESQQAGLRNLLNGVAEEIRKAGFEEELLTAKFGKSDPVANVHRVAIAMESLLPMYRKPDGTIPPFDQMVKHGLNAAFPDVLRAKDQAKQLQNLKDRSQKRLGSSSTAAKKPTSAKEERYPAELGEIFEQLKA